MGSGLQKELCVCVCVYSFQVFLCQTCKPIKVCEETFALSGQIESPRFPPLSPSPLFLSFPIAWFLNCLKSVF